MRSLLSNGYGIWVGIWVLGFEFRHLRQPLTLGCQTNKKSPSKVDDMENQILETRPKHTFELGRIRGRPVFDLGIFWTG